MTLLTCLVIGATVIIYGGNYVERKMEGSINKWKVRGVKRCRKCLACSRKEKKHFLACVKELKWAEE